MLRLEVMNRSSFHPGARQRQRGYILLVILLMLALLIIGMLAAAPRIATQIKRDREQEMIHRGQQYAIAVKRYYKKFGRYPVKIEDLESANNMRFLRRAYKNPTDPKGAWRLLHFGEVKTVLKMPGAAGGQLVGTPAGALSGATSPAPAIGQPIQGQPGQPAAGTTTGGPKVFGGGPIVGVAGTVDKPSLIVWHDKSDYKDWEFFYDPRLDTNAAAAAAGATGATPAGATGALGTPIGGTPTPATGPSPLQPTPMPPDQGPQPPR
jgi:type II secretory pathway pseudopilin PulG